MSKRNHHRFLSIVQKSFYYLRFIKTIRSKYAHYRVSISGVIMGGGGCSIAPFGFIFGDPILIQKTNAI